MSEQEPEIVVTGENRGPSVGRVIAVAGTAVLDPGYVAGQYIRNKQLENGGDDLGGVKPTVESFVRAAEAIGDGLNDRGQDSGNSFVAKFNRASGFGIAGVPVVPFTPVGGIVNTVSNVVNSRETFPNKVGDFALGAAKSVPIVGSIVKPIAGFLDGNADVGEVKRGIQFLSQRNVPGFRFEETEIDGHKVRIYVSAADTIANGDAKPWVHIDADGIKRSDPKIQESARAVLGRVESDIYDFITAQTDKAIAEGSTPSPYSTQGALHDRIRGAVADAGVISAPVESGRIVPNNPVVSSTSIAADMAFK